MRLRKRVEDQRARLDRQRDRIDRASRQSEKLLAKMVNQTKVLERHQKSLTELRAALQPLEQIERLRDVDFSRALTQLGALEIRMGRIEERLENDTFTSDDESLSQARSLVDTVRREHDQVRVRLQVISSYEERLRRLESALIVLYDKDLRDPV